MQKPIRTHGNFDTAVCTFSGSADDRADGDRIGIGVGGAGVNCVVEVEANPILLFCLSNTAVYARRNVPPSTQASVL